MSEQHTEEVVRGERVCRSALSGSFFLVTKWIDDGDGKVTALQKEEISDEEVVEHVDGELPPEWKKQIDQSLWNEVDEL